MEVALVERVELTLEAAVVAEPQTEAALALVEVEL